MTPELAAIIGHMNGTKEPLGLLKPNRNGLAEF